MASIEDYDLFSQSAFKVFFAGNVTFFNNWPFYTHCDVTMPEC